MPNPNKECIRSYHLDKRGSRPDTLLMSIRETHEDGTVSKYIDIVTNYMRPYYVTRPSKRGHKQKKSIELKENVKTFYTTDSDLQKNVPRKLPFPYNGMDFYRAKNSPYLYGTDQSAEFLSKLEYNKDKPIPRLDYGAFDIETDVLDLYENKVIIESSAYEDNVFVSIQDKFLQHRGIDDPIKALEDCAKEHLGKYIDEGLKIEFSIDNAIETIRKPIMKLHEWKPDIVGVWNIAYDLPFVEGALEKLNVNPKDIFSDPELPRELRNYWFKRGPSEMIDKNGVSTRLGFHQRWHMVYSSSYFEWLDAMCTFAEHRSQEAKRPSFGLDAILREFLNLTKLGFDKVEKDTKIESIVENNQTLSDLIEGLKKARKSIYVKSKLDLNVEHHVEGLEHHMLMQKKYPIEYIIYNVFDSYCMILLERVLKDMSLKLPVFMGSTPWRDFKRRARRLSDTVHLYAAEKGCVAGACYSTYPEEDILPLSGWIITADAYKLRDNGNKCVVSNPNLVTSIYTNLMEVDLKSSYPMLYRALGNSKSTRWTTVAYFNEGEFTDLQQKAMINVMHGPVNALDTSRVLLKMPSVSDVMDYLDTKVQ